MRVHLRQRQSCPRPTRGRGRCVRVGWFGLGVGIVQNRPTKVLLQLARQVNIASECVWTLTSIPTKSGLGLR